MEECVRLVCETLGVHSGDEVSVEQIVDLHQNVFHVAPELGDAQRAVAQVRAQNGGLPCSGRWILHVLLEMEKKREKREKMFWELQMFRELQMLKSDRSGTTDAVTAQTPSHTSISKDKKKQNTKPYSLSVLLSRTRRLLVRLDIDGIWSILPSPSQSHVTVRRLSLISPTKSDVLLLLQYKYDVIKARLYTEMLQADHGTVRWTSMEASEQTDCVCDLEQSVEEALKLKDVLCVCELPGILHCYTSPDEVSEQSWSAAVFLCELHSHCDEERHTLTHLLNRVERRVLAEIYLSVCVAVRRAERETHSHTALLSSRQHWDKWPCVRRSCVEELVKFWLQEKQDSSTQHTIECRTTRCVRQAVLQCVLQCQEQERRTLVEILHTASQEDLQDQSHTRTPDYSTVGSTVDALRRGCVFVLKQIKSSLQRSSTHSSASWGDCAVHLLSQLTHTHDQQVQSVIHTLPDMDAASLLVLLHKYEVELRLPKLHNLHNLLQTINNENISGSDEQSRRTASVNEGHEICTGCGVALNPDEAPYLEIPSDGGKRKEEKRAGNRGEGEERERRQVEDETKKEGREEEREAREDEEERGEEEEMRNVDAVEKQASLITLAWSKPTNNNTQEVTSALPEFQTRETTSADAHTPNHTHSASSQSEHTVTAHTLVEPLQEQSTSSMDTESRRGEHTSAAAQELDSENTAASSDTHTHSAVCDAVCEEQQIQREVTMRSLVDIQRRAEQRWQRERERQILRVQERLSIVQNRKSDEDLLGLRRKETFRHLTTTLQQEDKQQQKVLVREKLQQLWRERSYVLQSRRERNTTEFKELLTPTAQSGDNADVLTTHTPTQLTRHST